MIWNHWSKSDLQRELERFHPGLLPRLGEIINTLNGILSEKQESIYNRTSLVKALTHFAPENIFNDKKYWWSCLNRLEPSKLELIGQKLDLKTKGFATLRDEVVEKISKDPQSNRFLADFLGLPKRFTTLPAEKYNDFKDLEPGNNQDKAPLLDFQQDVFLKALQELEVPGRRVLIQMPTGSGKTRTALEVVSHFLEKEEHKPVVFWLAHSEELCQQAFDSFESHWCGRLSKPVRVSRLWSQHLVPQSVSKPLFVVASFQKLYGLLEKEELDALISRLILIVVDEAHRSVAPSYQEVLESLAGSKVKVLGLSATPGRLNENETASLIDQFHGNIIEISKTTEDGVIEYLQSHGVLAKIQTKTIITELNFSMNSREKKHLKQFLDFPLEFLNRIAQSELRNAEIAARVYTECQQERRLLLFACNVQHSQFLNGLFGFIGIKSAHLDANTAKAERHEMISKFRSAELQVLCNFNILTAGFDAPNADVILIARPTTSPILYSQMIGRGLRGPKMGGSEECMLIDVKDNIEGWGGMGELYQSFRNLWRI